MSFKRPRKRKRAAVGVGFSDANSLFQAMDPSTDSDPLLSQSADSVERPRKRRRVQFNVSSDQTSSPPSARSIEPTPSLPEPSSDPLLRLRNLLGNLRAHKTQNEYVRSKNTVSETRANRSLDSVEASDQELESDLESLHLLWTRTDWFVPFVRQFRGHVLLVELLSHPNVDVSAGVCRLLAEATDPELVMQQEDCLVLSVALVRTTPIIQLLGTLLRRRGTIPSRACYDLLTVLENFCQLVPALFDILSEESTGGSVLDGILHLISVGPSDNLSLFHYACEVLSVVSVHPSSSIIRLLSPQRISQLLRFLNLVVGQVSRSDLSGVEELDMRESFGNLMGVLSAMFLSNESRVVACGAGVVEVLVRIARKNRSVRSGVLAVLDTACLLSSECCGRFVGARGLGVVFGVLMKRRKKKKRGNDASKKEGDEHVISCLLSLTKWTAMRRYEDNETEEEEGETRPQAPPSLPPPGFDSKQRILKKFEEKNAEKTRRLIEILKEYVDAVTAFDESVANGSFQRELLQRELIPEEEMEDRIFMTRLERGLMIILQCAVLICFVASSSSEAVRALVLRASEEAGFSTEGLIQFVDVYAETVNDLENLLWCENLKRGLMTG